MDDAEVVREVLQGKFAAYEELIRRYAPQVAAVCRALIPRQQDVEDLAQETFLRGLGRLSDLREPDKFGPWLAAIARNLCREWNRDPHNDCLSLDVTLAPSTAPETDEDAAAMLVSLKACVRRLPDELREAIELYYGSARTTYAEVAEALSVSFGKVNQMLTLSRRLLRDCLKRRGINL